MAEAMKDLMPVAVAGQQDAISAVTADTAGKDPECIHATLQIRIGIVGKKGRMMDFSIILSAYHLHTIYSFFSAFFVFLAIVREGIEKPGSPYFKDFRDVWVRRFELPAS